VYDRRFGKGQPQSALPVAALALLLLLSLPVHLFNKPLFLWLNSLHSPLTDTFWLTFTTMGDGLFLGIIIGAFVVKNPRVTVLGLILIVLATVLVHMLKAAFPGPRPAASGLEPIHVVGPLLRSGSFPSGHTAAAISAALAVWHCYESRLVGGLAILVALLIALSRIFVGAHFPQDLVGGAIWALAAFVLIDTFFWPMLKPIIPDRPDVSRKWFRIALRIEIAVAVFAILIWGPCAAESPVAGVALGAVVLVFVTRNYLKLAHGSQSSQS
jgi:membrane-associated phospholipid phosphatase